MENCVYRIRNTINNKVYIGSTIDFGRRKNEHLSQLDNGVHINTYLQRAYKKHGKDAFVFDVIEHSLEKGELVKKEQHYIDLFNSSNSNFGYNISQYADRPDGRKYIKVYAVNQRNALIKSKLSVNSLALLSCMQPYLEQYTNRVSHPNGKSFSNKDISEIIDISHRTIVYALKELDDKSFIKRLGSSNQRQIFINPNLMTSGTEIQKETYEMFEKDGDIY